MAVSAFCWVGWLLLVDSQSGHYYWLREMRAGSGIVDCKVAYQVTWIPKHLLTIIWRHNNEDKKLLMKPGWIKNISKGRGLFWLTSISNLNIDIRCWVCHSFDRSSFYLAECWLFLECKIIRVEQLEVLQQEGSSSHLDQNTYIYLPPLSSSPPCQAITELVTVQAGYTPTTQTPTKLSQDKKILCCCTKPIFRVSVFIPGSI